MAQATEQHGLAVHAYVWMSNHIHLLDSDADWMTLMRYIELNRVRAGMVAHARNYAGSSCARNADGGEGANAELVKSHEVYRAITGDLHERFSAWRTLFDAAIDNADLDRIRDCPYNGGALGDARFKPEIQSRTGRHSRSKGVGRPRVAGQAIPQRWRLPQLVSDSRNRVYDGNIQI